MTGSAARSVSGTPPGPKLVKPRPILELRNVGISYMVRAGELKVVPNVSLALHEGEALGLVGESGCGKSTLAYAIMRYLGGSGRLSGGQILFEGRDMGKMSDAELRSIRGSRRSEGARLRHAQEGPQGAHNVHSPAPILLRIGLMPGA